MNYFLLAPIFFFINLKEALLDLIKKLSFLIIFHDFFSEIVSFAEPPQRN